MLHLPNVTLIGIDCVEVSRLQHAFDISCRDITFGAVKLLTSLPTTDPRAVSTAPLTTIDAYSQFCLRELYRYVDTPYALIIQHDGFILNASAWSDDFLAYDYLGAPILVGTWAYRLGAREHDLGTLLVGNGGFSLRSKRLLKCSAELIEEGRLDPHGPEDWVLCYRNRELLEGEGITFAPITVAERFSFEGRSRDCCRWDTAFGFHSLKWTDISKWLAVHPEYQGVVQNNFDINLLT